MSFTIDWPGQQTGGTALLEPNGSIGREADFKVRPADGAGARWPAWLLGWPAGMPAGQNMHVKTRFVKTKNNARQQTEQIVQCRLLPKRVLTITGKGCAQQKASLGQLLRPSSAQRGARRLLSHFLRIFAWIIFKPWNSQSPGKRRLHATPQTDTRVLSFLVGPCAWAMGLAL